MCANTAGMKSHIASRGGISEFFFGTLTSKAYGGVLFATWKPYRAYMRLYGHPYCVHGSSMSDIY